jgi:hypothetical protein
MATEKLSNNAKTTVASGLANVTNPVTFVVASAGGFPTAGNFRILVEAEILLVTAVAGTSFTASRAQEGTAAASHANGAAVTHILTAGGMDAFVATRGPGALIDFSSWVSPTVADSALLQMLAGTAATPSTTRGPLATYDKTITLSAAGCQNAFDPNCGATVRIGAQGSAANAQQVTGLSVQADNRATVGALVGGDTAAISSYARAQAGLAIAFFGSAARRSGDSATVRPHAIELNVENRNGTDCVSNDAGDGCYGVFAISVADIAGRHNSAGFATRSTGANNSTEQAFYHGFECTSNGATTSCFEDVSRAVSALRARGTAYVDVIDLSGATAGNSGIKLSAASGGRIVWPSMTLNPAFPEYLPQTDNTGRLGSDANRWNLIRGNAVKANVFADSAGVQGIDAVKTIRNSAGTGTCTMTFNAGLFTASTC